MAVQLHNQLQANQHNPPEQRVQLLITLLNAGGYGELAALLQEQAARQRQQQLQRQQAAAAAAAATPTVSDSGQLDVFLRQAPAAGGGAAAPTSSGHSQGQQHSQGMQPSFMLTSSGFPAATLQQQQQLSIKQEQPGTSSGRAGGGSSSMQHGPASSVDAYVDRGWQQPRQPEPSDSPTQVWLTDTEAAVGSTLPCLTLHPLPVLFLALTRAPVSVAPCWLYCPGLRLE
jgi:hypothetical protein